jgi:hypothetical protein
MLHLVGHFMRIFIEHQRLYLSPQPCQCQHFVTNIGPQGHTIGVGEQRRQLRPMYTYERSDTLAAMSTQVQLLRDVVSTDK